MAWLSTPIRGLLLDITGVLYESGQNRAIEGSLEAIEKLQHSQIKYKFVTNESQATTQSIVKKLKNFGYNLSENDVLAPAPTVKQILQQRNLRPYFITHPNVLAEFEGIKQSEPYDCVVIGDAVHHFTYEKLNKAFQILISMKEPLLISMGKGKFYKEHDKLVLDVGAYTAGLEFAVGTPALIMGKPSKEYFSFGLESLQLKPEEVVMIGDDISSDVGGAQQCGMRGVLVRTGKYRDSDENHPVKPDAIVDNLLAAVDSILSVNG